MLHKKESSTTVWIACTIVCLLIGVAFGISRISNQAAKHRRSYNHSNATQAFGDDGELLKSPPAVYHTSQ